MGNERFLVRDGATLNGQVQISGTKNSVLKLMSTVFPAEDTAILTNRPEIDDVPLMQKVLEGLGCSVIREGDRIEITVPEELLHHADFDAVRQLRASVCVLGPLTTHTHNAIVALPGGDAIGSRPLDMHQAGLEKLGARTYIHHGCVAAEAGRLEGANTKPDFPSVGATENILTAAVLAEDTIVLDNAAREPRIVDLCEILTEMGAKISGVGSNTITVEDVEKLHPAEHKVAGNRIIAGTWAYAAAMTGGDITVVGTNPKYLHLPLEKLKNAGAQAETYPQGSRVRMDGCPQGVNYQTLPYPGLPTDIQPMAIVLSAVSEGTSVLTENVFEPRFRFVDEMIRLDANATIDDHHVMIRGKETLSSAPVWSSGIYAGAGLVLTGLCTEGGDVTEVHDVYRIDHGYPGFIETLSALGVSVERVS